MDKLEVKEFKPGRFGITNGSGWFAYHYGNSDHAEQVKKNIAENVALNFNRLKVNFAYSEPQLPANII